ncbi:MAG TPA: AAA family ATPase [Desulfobaccales bacterium]|nr:AAA family ATPase [Desulfobaccales bacterium]
MGRLIVVIFGLMATGKTTLAQALGESLGWAVIHSDTVRKSLAGLAPTTRAPYNFGQGIYSEDFSKCTYTEMLRLAQGHLAAGHGVILDGSFKRALERKRVRQLARGGGVKVLFVYCECPPEVARERLGIRLTDPEAISDGRVELFEDQIRDFDPLKPEDRPVLCLDTSQDLEVVLEELEEFVKCFQDEANSDES